MYSGSVTGERLHEDEVDDAIPGATPFFQVDLDDVKSGNYTPPAGIPSNPQEYLKSVVHEARNIPDVVVAKIDPRKMTPKVKSAKYVTSSKDFAVKPPSFHSAPLREWQEQQLAKFAVAREQFTRHLARLKSINRQTKKRPKLPVYPLPPWNHEESWKCLCFGKSLKIQKLEHADIKLDEETSGSRDCLTAKNASVEKECVSDEDDDLCEALAAAGATTADVVANDLTNDCDDDRIIDLENLERGFPPMMRILLRMDSNQVEANLEYHNKWMDEYGFSHEQGRWIYALLTCLEKPLFPTIISLLRDLCRKCAEHRRIKENLDSHFINGLNLIICIIGRYFDQTDLADPW